jgi:hypothetical protein
MLFRAGWIHDAINDATENNPTARANGRTALNTIFLIIFMNIMCPSPSFLSFIISNPVPPPPPSRSAYTLFFMDRDRILALPRRLQHPFSLGFWRLGRAAGVMLMDATRILEATQRMETCMLPSPPLSLPLPPLPPPPLFSGFIMEEKLALSSLLPPPRPSLQSSLC